MPETASQGPATPASAPADGNAAADAAPQAPRLRPSGPIVPAAETGVWSEAQGALAAANQHLVLARSWAKNFHESERKRGYAEGWEAGAEKAARLLAETALRAAEQLNALERELPSLVHEIVAAILGDLDAEELIARSVRRAVAGLQPGTEAVLRVAPGDVDEVSAALADREGCAMIRIEADPARAPGETSLRSGLGSIELGIEAQLRALRGRLEDARPSAVDGPAAMSTAATVTA